MFYRIRHDHRWNVIQIDEYRNTELERVKREVRESTSKIVSQLWQMPPRNRLPHDHTINNDYLSRVFNARSWLEVKALYVRRKCTQII